MTTTATATPMMPSETSRKSVADTDTCIDRDTQFSWIHVCIYISIEIYIYIAVHTELLI